MSQDTHIYFYMRSLSWIKREMRKATNLPPKEMIPRIEQLLGKAKSLGREVNKFLEQKDASS